MKLSQAILLGDSLKRSDPKQWLSEDGSCGCAIGGALLAVGRTEVVSYKMDFEGRTLIPNFVDGQLDVDDSPWPWLTDAHTSIISQMYYGVADGTCTIEQLCDYVRSIEPSEPDEFSQLVDVLKEEKVEV